MQSEAEKGPDKTSSDPRKVYTEIVIDHAQNPRNLGQIPDADGFASVVGSCGDTMEICLRVRNDKVLNAVFFTDGCGTTIAAGSMVTEMAKGKSVSDAFKITQQDILNALGGLPEESRHCALLASDTLRAAVRDYFTYKNQPWKRVYRAH
jgi:nitrogen fixation NifU-like protein